LMKYMAHCMKEKDMGVVNLRASTRITCYIKRQSSKRMGLYARAKTETCIYSPGGWPIKCSFLIFLWQLLVALKRHAPTPTVAILAYRF